MKISEAYPLAVKLLEDGGTDDSAFEVDCILKNIFNVDRVKRISHPELEIDYDLLNGLIGKRLTGFPLQYIIGKWDFYGFEYKVGEGVLIPRPETELLVEKSMEFLKGIRHPVIYDLCAGTGCIGLTLARLIPDSKVYLFEKSSRAFSYLSENADGVSNAFPVKADIFTIDCEEYNKPDLIVSNPPYIKTDEIPSLQKEVLKEPEIALDGGKDGLDFYRLIFDKWLPVLNDKGIIAVECGEEQADDIIKLFSPACKKCFSVRDFSGTNRIVIGEK